METIKAIGMSLLFFWIVFGIIILLGRDENDDE